MKIFWYNPCTSGKEGINSSAEDWKEARQIEKSDRNYRIALASSITLAGIALLAGSFFIPGLPAYARIAGATTGGVLTLPGMVATAVLTQGGYADAGIFKIKSEQRDQTLRDIQKVENFEELFEALATLKLAEKHHLNQATRCGMMTKKATDEIKEQREYYLSTLFLLSQPYFRTVPTYREAYKEKCREFEEFKDGFAAWFMTIRYQIADPDIHLDLQKT